MSMPFFGLLSFLQITDNMSIAILIIVSMPFFGLLSFLQNDEKIGTVSECVSMPFFGLLSFLQYPPETLCL